MSPTSHDQIDLTDPQRRELAGLIRAGTTAQRLALRALIVLMAADGQSTTAIAASLDVCEDTARKWRRRWCQTPSWRRSVMRNGPVVARFSPRCRSPGSRRWPAGHQTAAGCRCRGGRVRNWPGRSPRTGSASPSQPRRCAGWLTEDTIKPWQYRSWIFITDPDFQAKAQKVLDLYARTWNGKPLTANEYVISADEKTSIQARCRCLPTLPPGRARMMRVNHDYHRGGAVAYLAAYDVHRAKIHGRCEDTTGIVPFTALSSR